MTIVRFLPDGQREIVDTSNRRINTAAPGFVSHAVAGGVSNIDSKVAYLSARLVEAQKLAALDASKGGHATYHAEQVRKLQMQLNQLEETRDFALQQAEVTATQEAELIATRPAVSVAPAKPLAI